MNPSEAVSLRGRLCWYATATLGPMSSAAVQFLLSLTLLARLPVDEFGRVSFVFVVSQFSVGLWSALFTSPMLVLAAKASHATADDADSANELAGVEAAHQLALVPNALVMGLVALAVGLATVPAALYVTFAVLMLVRQFARVRATARAQYRQVMLSDLTYSAALLVGVAILALLPAAGEAAALAVLAAAVLAATTVFVSELSHWRPPGLLKQARTYRQVWRRDARWSLTGVITTEATVNCHSYIVTALLGSAAFAPIAATALFIRPITVVINALAEFERARAAHRFARSQTDLMALARRHMRLLLLAIWVSTAVLAAVVIAYAPQRFMVGKFGMAAVSSGTVLWLLVAMARLLHAPEGLILLAAGRFRQLAWISTWTAIVSVLSVLAIVLSGFTVSSIAGIVLGEGAFAFAAWRAASQLLSRANASSCPTG